MNWNKAKTILIVFFTIVNLFLLYTIISRNINDYYISEETISNAIAVLNNNGITIDKSIIPQKNITVDQYEADNIVDDYDGFAKRILGDDYIKYSDTVYESTRGKIEYFGDKFTFTGDYNGNTSKNEANELSVLNSLGIKISDYEYSEGVFRKNINNINVFDCELSVCFYDGKLTISGIWFEKNREPISENTELKPITTVLIDLLSSEEKPEGAAEITDLELGYMVYEEQTYHKSIVLIPSWKIKFSNETYAYLDARANS